MEDVQPTVVEASVDAGQAVTEQTESSHTESQGTTVETTPEKDNYGPIITAEVARREEKLQKKYEEQYGQHSKNLDRVAKHYGYDSPDEFLQAMDEFDKEQQLQEEAARLSVPVEALKKLREEIDPVKSELETLKLERAQLQLEKKKVEIAAQMAELTAKYPDFNNYNEQIYTLVTQSRYDLEHAYMVASFQDKIENTRKQAEAETIRNLQNNAATSPGSLSEGDSEHKSGFANLSREDQRRMIEEVKQGKRTSLN